MCLSIQLPNEIARCPFVDSYSPVRKNIFKLSPNHSPVNEFSDEAKGKPVSDNVLHAGAFRNLFKEM